MNITFKLIAASIMAIVGSVTTASITTAAPSPGWQLSKTDNNYYAYFEGDRAEVFVAPSRDADCFTVDVSGTETNFSVTITALSGDYLDDFLQCIGLLNLADISAEGFIFHTHWKDFVDGTEKQEDNPHSCLNVSVTEGANNSTASENILWNELPLDEANSETEGSVVPADERTFTDVVGFGSEIRLDGSFNEKLLEPTWTHNYLVTDCGGSSGRPGSNVGEDLLEHYQRQAELIEASALPDTL